MRWHLRENDSVGVRHVSGQADRAEALTVRETFANRVRYLLGDSAWAPYCFWVFFFAIRFRRLHCLEFYSSPKRTLHPSHDFHLSKRLDSALLKHADTPLVSTAAIPDEKAATAVVCHGDVLRGDYCCRYGWLYRH